MKEVIDDMNIIAQDAYEIAQTLHGSNNNIPYIVLGHSMGSIIARLFVEKYPDIAQGLILTGTGQYQNIKGYGHHRFKINNFNFWEA